MHLKSEPGRLTVTSQWRLVDLAAYAVMLAVVFGYCLYRQGVSPYSIVLALQAWAGLLLMAFVFARPRAIETLFDLDRGKVTQIDRRGFLARVRTTTHDLADIASLGVREDTDILRQDYLPVLRLKSGQVIRIAVNGGTARETRTLLDSLCRATGLPRIDIPAR